MEEGTHTFERIRPLQLYRAFFSCSLCFSPHATVPEPHYRVALSRFMPGHMGVEIAQWPLRVRRKCIEVLPFHFKDEDFALGPQVPESEAQNQIARSSFSRFNHT